MHSVLVADADQELRRTVAAWIEAYGFSVHETASAEEALEEMEVSQHAVVLCDASAAGRDGVWLAWRLRERCPNTAIIVATAIRDCETAVSRLRNDVVDYLLKPFGRERLYEALSLRATGMPPPRAPPSCIRPCRIGCATGGRSSRPRLPKLKPPIWLRWTD